ncbi:hypothetical protein [Niallia circulans]|uniref:hypothetical protein n=1 Tax=Niallia circulans TaxID=1397 RepID=UPI00300BD61B
MSNVDPRILKAAEKLGKRPKAVVDHIIKYGAVSTKELKEQYGYEQPPRAAQDVKEYGIPLEPIPLVDSDTKKRYVAYTFGDVDKLKDDIFKGRQNFPKKFKQKLYKEHDNHCIICNIRYSTTFLQVDHRLPFTIAGDDIDLFALDTKEYMPLCRMHNRTKSHACENCFNWLNDKDVEVCKKCFWASPENYVHIATQEEKHIELVFRNEDINTYEKLFKKANDLNIGVQEYIIQLLNKS